MTRKLIKLDAKEAIGSNLKRLRAVKGLKQDELARLSGISQGAISHIEKGTRWPDYETLCSLCKALRVEHTDLTSHPDMILALNKMDAVRLERK